MNHVERLRRIWFKLNIGIEILYNTLTLPYSNFAFVLLEFLAVSLSKIVCPVSILHIMDGDILMLPDY